MSEPKTVEEQFLCQRNINMRLIINRSHAHMRFMDFRVGNYEQKRNALDETARNEGLRKVFTLVEKQDSKNWRGVGFVREGVYPSFFRTADAYAMCRHYNETGDPLPAQAIKRVDEEEYPEVALKNSDQLCITEIKDEAGKAALMNKFNGHFKALPFGRVTTPDLVLRVSARKKEGWACAEIDDSYGHATVGFYPGPTGAKGTQLGAQALVSLLEVLDKKKVANLFGLAAVSDELSNGLFSQLDFHITGRLTGHLQTSEGASTALVWHRRRVTGQK